MSAAGCRLALASALALAAAGASAPRAQESLYFGKTGVEPPARTDAGSFSGTWFYVNRDWKVALWIEDQEGSPQVKLRLLSIATAEGFETEWGGHAEYAFRGMPGRFDARVERRDADTIEGVWDWELGEPGRRRIERAKFKLYRAADGRQAVFQFDDFERVYEERPPRLYTERMIWTFRKVSRRQALWAELPF